MRVDETHHIHVFRSDGGTWTHKPLALGSDAYMHLSPTKAIALGGGDLGWVDLRQCIIVCNVLDDDPRPRLIPLPNLLPSNQLDKQRHNYNQRECRDVLVRADAGSIICVEIEHCMMRFGPRDVSTADVLYDSELPVGMYASTPPYMYKYTGWRIITWNRAPFDNCWRKGDLVHADDVIANDPGHTALLLPMEGEISTVRHLDAEVPSLSMHGGDVVYGCVQI